MNHLKLRSNLGPFYVSEIETCSFICLPSRVDNIQAPCSKLKEHLKAVFLNNKCLSNTCYPEAEACSEVWANLVPQFPL